MELFKTHDDVTINYRTSGEGNAILLLHTAFDNFTVFNELEKRLQKDYQVVLMDLRGHGYSDRLTSIRFEDYIPDIKALLDKLYIDECAIIGHELGGSVAVAFAAEYPETVTSLNLVNPTILEDDLPSERLYRHYAFKIRNWDEDKREKFLDKHLYYSKKEGKKFAKQISDTNSLNTESENKAVRNSFINTNMRHYLAKITTPTLVIAGQHGERTTIVEAKEVADYLPNAQFEVFEKSGLYPFAEEKDQFLKIALKFIQAHESELVN
ncbi:alpha/beta hydrolase [Staphylococcus sp. SQ8-PEA]|uniref:Alpha/beta hydrolase n=1 Tax=Staphylococcus marylandisciuri TaxID=2981529 RepID=A0ABT2QSG2_9STAP|nr:alpha/beta hydrolase [Staphylococcus marylandisciuri]MCU5746888.1 alpha/beta hydrolase [Staphylococcus marylandisciuri]